MQTIMRRRAAILAAVAVLGTVVSAQARVIFVNATATGLNNGTKWDDAFVDVSEAIASAVDGDEVWIAQATYTADNWTQMSRQS